MHWKGPFRIVDVVGKFDYRVDIGRTVTTFHANLLKRYHRRDEDQLPEVDHPTPLDVAATSVIEDEDFEVNDHYEVFREDPLQIPNFRQTQTVHDVTMSEGLTAEQKKQLRRLLWRYSDVLTDVPAVTQAGFHDIKLTDDRPIRSRPYPLPHALREVVKEEVKEMLGSDSSTISDSLTKLYSQSAFQRL